MAAHQTSTPSVTDVAARWLALEQVFSEERYDGGRPPWPVEVANRVVESTSGLLESLPGTRPHVVITAPHATNHVRAGAMKVADRGTGGLALLLAELTGATALIALHSTGDANFDVEHPLKVRLAELRPALVIDLHGMRRRPGSDVDLGAGDGLVPDAFVSALRASSQVLVTVNEVFDAMRPTTVTAFSQDLGIRAVQAEIGAHLRPPMGESADLGRLALLIAGAINASEALVPEAAVPGAVQISRPATAVRIPSGVPSVVVPPDLLPGTTGPIPVSVAVDGATVHAWAWASSTPGMPEAVQVLPPGHFGLTRRLTASLETSSGGQDAVRPVTVTFPGTAQLKPLAALVDDLPAGDEVQVSPDEFPGPPRRYLLVRGGVTAWVTAVPRAHVRPGTVRAGYQLRLLTETEGADEAGDFTLVAAGSVRSASRRALSAWGQVRAAWRLLHLGLDQATEVVLRFLFRAPTAAVRVIQAHPGDDGQAIVALHPAVFDRIGLEPGQQVLVRWGPNEVVAVAVEDHDPPSVGAPPEGARKVQRVNRLTPDLPDGVAPHVVARLSSSLRLALDAPVATVVSVRRRMRPILVGNLYTLVIPLASLVLAGAALEDPNWWLINAGTLAMSVFALAKLRIPRPRAEMRVDREWQETLAGDGEPSAKMSP
ncbi:hypothetical protein [Antribacter gilvus]|uniref:hypothetical protein n=1 Tax=Antribacter gilvus TaxID=2304675 RepID=UPI000F773774|nr:hypothetical protein [Antribacter gilvus]